MNRLAAFGGFHCPHLTPLTRKVLPAAWTSWPRSSTGRRGYHRAHGDVPVVPAAAALRHR